MDQHKSGLKLITRLSKAYAGQNREGLRQPMLTIQFFYFSCRIWTTEQHEPSSFIHYHTVIIRLLLTCHFIGCHSLFVHVTKIREKVLLINHHDRESFYHDRRLKEASTRCCCRTFVILCRSYSCCRPFSKASSSQWLS